MSVHEHFSIRSWFQEVRQRYTLEKTTLRDTPEAFTILFNPKPNKTLLVGRWCRRRQYGVVICQRNRDISVEYDRRQVDSH